jgi:hypothetical protein
MLWSLSHDSLADQPQGRQIQSSCQRYSSQAVTEVHLAVIIVGLASFECLCGDGWSEQQSAHD